MQATKEWLEKWEKVKNKLQPNSNLLDYFKRNRWKRSRCYGYRALLYSNRRIFSC